MHVPKKSLPNILPSSSHSALHLRVPAVLLARRRCLDPEDIVAPYQHLAEGGSQLLVDELLGVGELDVHVAVDGDEDAFVFGLSPLEAHYYFFVHTANS
jgi:hypothetical protein